MGRNLTKEPWSETPVDGERPESAAATRLSELLLHHAALGDGYVSPFPAARGMVFTSAIGKAAHANLLAAEKQFAD